MEHAIRGLKIFCSVSFHFKIIWLIFPESADDLEFRARAHAVLRCCTTDCFMSSIGYRFPDAVNVLVSCYNEVNGMGRKQKKEYMRYFPPNSMALNLLTSAS